MKTTTLALGSSLLLFACSGGDSTIPDGGGDSSMMTGQDSSMMMMQDSSTMNDGGGMDSSTNDSSMGDDASAMDGGGNLMCQKPGDCNDGGMGNVCCATVVLGNGNPPNCPVNNVTTACKAANMCQTKLALQCSTTEQFRACTKNADCTEQTYNKCCTFMQGMNTFSVCLNNQLAMLGNGTCQ